MVRLRGHHLLCLHGFRGLGYSPEFVSNMRRIRDELLKSPESEIHLLDLPDDICAACPHLSDGKCTRSGEDSESRVAQKDIAVLDRLSLRPGDKLTAKEIFSLAADEFSSGLSDVCRPCSWLGLGYCEEGLRKRSMSA